LGLCPVYTEIGAFLPPEPAVLFTTSKASKKYIPRKMSQLGKTLWGLLLGEILLDSVALLATVFD
jgi:hypothetical protein